MRDKLLLAGGVFMFAAGLGGIVLGIWRVAHGQIDHGCLNLMAGIAVAGVGIGNIREAA